jgi:hypothetical protein
MRRRARLVPGLLLAMLSAAASAQTPPGIAAFSQSAPGTALPGGWKPLEFPNIARTTRYTLVRDPDGATVLRAQADASASGLAHPLDGAADARPLLRWRWKVERPVARSDVTRRDGDDFAARVYVTFRYAPERLPLAERVKFETLRLLYGEYPPHAGLTYIWDANAPVGTLVPNPYTARARMIVVENGTARLNRWLEYERDIVADYRRAFGEAPPPLAGIAIMTDTDNTGESAVAYYGDITLQAR